jgi:hypothetical protein
MHSGETSGSPWYCGDCNFSACIQIVNGDALVFIGRVLDYAFCEDIKGPSQEDIICW